MAGFFDFLNNVPQSQNNQSNQPPPTSWNTRTPMPTSSPSPSDGSSWNTRIPFTPSPPQDNTQPQQSDPSSAPSSGGFFSNLWGRVTGAMSGVGNALTGNNDPNQAHGMDRWQQVAQDLTHPGQMLQHNIDAIKNIPSALMQGFAHPDQATQGWDQGINKDADSLPAGASQMLKYGIGGLNNPLTIMPVGKILQGIKYGADAAHITPYVSAAAQAVKASPVVDNAAVNGIKDALGTMFKNGYGTMADTKPTMDALGHTMSADQYAIMHKMDELRQSHGLTPVQMAEVPHVMDTGMPSQDMKVNQAVKELRDTLSGGFNSAHGKVYGTDAELRNTHIGSAPTLQDLFAQNAGNTIRSGAVENYYPRRFNNTPEEVAAALDKYNGLQKGLSTNGVFNKAREFPTLQDAIDHGLKPEMNPYMAVGQRLGETSKAVNTDSVIKQLKYAGVIKDAHEPGLTESTTNPFTSYIKNVTDPKTGEESSFINRSYMKPADESYIQRTLDPQGAKTAVENVLDKIGKYSGYDPTINFLKKLVLLNPLVHGHNLIDNGMYLGGASGKDTLQTMGNLRKGISDPDYERALASGAISADSKGTSFSDALSKKLAPTEDKGMFQKALDAAKYGAHDFLWDADKGLRTSMSKQALEGGASGAEAAAKANRFLVDYKNITPFEQSVVKRIFPFYSWMKGNMPLQAEQWINNTPKQLLAHNTVRAGSDLMSGNDARDGKMDTGQTVSDGSHSMFDPYIASEDPAKLLRDTPIPFLFNRANPILRLLTQEMANKKYSPLPITAAPDKQYLNKTDIRLPGAEAQDSGYNTRATIAHILNGVNPFSGGPVGSLVGSTGGDAKSYIDKALGVNKKDKNGNDVDKPGATLPELLLPLTGGFTSRYNPDQEAKSKVYDDQQKLKDDITFKKTHGQYVSKAESRAAYRKIR